VGSTPVQSANASSPWLGTAIGGSLVLYGSRRRGILGTLVGLAGAGNAGLLPEFASRLIA
jgi:uncharacterized membrane protein